jgi:hypothetical protein
LKRGSIVVVASRGAYTGEPRPAAAISAEIGECDSRELEAVEDGLRRWLGLAS